MSEAYFALQVLCKGHFDVEVRCQHQIAAIGLLVTCILWYVFV